jgi:hypothetical protein
MRTKDYAVAQIREGRIQIPEAWTDDMPEKLTLVRFREDILLMPRHLVPRFPDLARLRSVTIKKHGWLQMTEGERTLFSSEGEAFLVHVGKAVHIFPNSDRWETVQIETQLAIAEVLPAVDGLTDRVAYECTDLRPTLISYASVDQEYADRLAEHLQLHSVYVWHYVPDVPFGALLTSPLERMMREASSVIVLMSPESAASEWVRREVAQAQVRGLLILPILLRGYPFPDFADRYFFDATNNELPPDSIIQSLKRTLTLDGGG